MSQTESKLVPIYLLQSTSVIGEIAHGTNTPSVKTTIGNSKRRTQQTRLP
jgi:hypothetical protein